MANERIAAIVRRQRGVVARRQLLACGLSAGAISSRIRNGRLFPVVRGVYSLGPHVDAWGQRYAAVLAVAPGIGRGPKPRARSAAVLSHWSAAQAHGLVRAAYHRHHVTLTGAGGRSATAVQVHRARMLLPTEVSLVEGLPVTSPARTILDCAAGASVGQVRKLIREAEYQRLLGPGEMADAIRLRPHHPGRSVAREADPQTAEAALRQTPLEDRMAALLAELPLPDALPQHAVTGASGRRYRADFAWPAFYLLIEADGRPAHDRSTSFDSDRTRDADLAAAGWMTLRFTSVLLRDRTQISATILATVRTREGIPTAAT